VKRNEDAALPPGGATVASRRLSVSGREVAALAVVAAIFVPLLLFAGRAMSLPSLLERGVESLIPGLADGKSQAKWSGKTDASGRFVLSGPEAWFYSDGSKQYEATWRAGVKTGRETYWMPDGKKLLFNDQGSLYTIPVEGGVPEKLNTGSAAKINNDHGISFDGKTLAISNSRDGLPGGGSSVYVLPLTGGEPRLLTEQTPSYWHGWNPNNKEVCM